MLTIIKAELFGLSPGLPPTMFTHQAIVTRARPIRSSALPTSLHRYTSDNTRAVAPRRNIRFCERRFV